jgi:hypothetical protein
VEHLKNDKDIVIRVRKIDVIKNNILQVNGEYILEVPTTDLSMLIYLKGKNMDQYFEEDIANYLIYNYHTHGYKNDWCNYPVGADEWKRMYYGDNKTVTSLLAEIYDQTKADDNYNKRMVYALKTLFNK